MFNNLSDSKLQGEHQMEMLDYVAAKFHEEPGVFKLLVRFVVQMKGNAFLVHSDFGFNNGTFPSGFQWTRGIG